MADQFAVPCGSGSRKMVDPGINPSDRVDDIRTIRGDLGADEKILRYRFFYPFFKPTLFFNRPPAIPDFPELIRGFIRMRGRPGDFLWFWRRLCAFGTGPLLVESLQKLLLLPNREVRIVRILFPISLFNKVNGVIGGADLCADRLTLSRYPAGFDQVLGRLAETRSRDEKCQEENKKRHASILKGLTEDCQPFDCLLTELLINFLVWKDWNK